MCRISSPFLNPSPLLLTLATSKLLRLDVKLVARDVKTYLLFQLGVCSDGVFFLLLWFAISKYCQDQSSCGPGSSVGIATGRSGIESR